MNNNWILIFTMAVTTYLMRVIPLTLLRKPIKNKFIRSFLFYVPYVTLAVMTVPAIFQATQEPIAGVIALIVGVVMAWLGAGLFPVAVTCCLCVFILELLL